MLSLQCNILKALGRTAAKRLFIGHKEVQFEKEGGLCKVRAGEGPGLGKRGAS